MKGVYPIGLCVSQDSHPTKVHSTERKLGSNNAVKFSKGTWHQKNRERKEPLRGIIHKCEPHERWPRKSCGISPRGECCKIEEPCPEKTEMCCVNTRPCSNKTFSAVGCGSMEKVMKRKESGSRRKPKKREVKVGKERWREKGVHRTLRGTHIFLSLVS